ncbi:hypothetical protein GGI25_002488 [Coemansia spiralis]|uniref:PH domain-containing protein n=2 Tax=Coemansia TaxID=4863 RepID=A0A9W8KZ14_9FUNG|nr:hypothetical protein EDC05_000951 [Coemansia umbellata]KAJ2624773.1 hypothetical protein GGI26_001189 [Coemansia sp. RSA 1358]KAJ2678316.1 hypothetical protein GGI25_002488 [Coemansia spiralis]
MYPQNGNSWQQHPHQQNVGAVAIPAGDEDDEDDHVPLSMMAAGMGQQQQPLPTAAMHGHPNQAFQPQQLQYQQQQLQQQMAYQQYHGQAPQQAYYPQQNAQQAMQPLDYQQQLEIELEQQQQQFQQQFLEQYRQMQIQQQLEPGLQEPVDDGFTGQTNIPTDYQHSQIHGYHNVAGFQDTPHNPNLPQYHAELIPPPMDANLHLTNYSQQQQQQPAINTTPRRRAAASRPWVKGNSGTNKGASAEMDADTNSSAALHSSFETEGCSDSSDASSSDESAYGIDSDEEKSKIPAAIVSIATPLSRVTSTAKPREQLNRPLSSASNSILVQESVSTSSGESSNLASKQATSYEVGDSDDDDLPLSVISSNSAQNSASLAAVRRTKSAMPSSGLSQRPQHIGTIAKKAPSMSPRGSSKSRSLSVRPNGSQSATRRESALQLPADLHSMSSIGDRSGHADSDNGDDEDEPLDQIKSELETGTRTATTSSHSDVGSVCNGPVPSRKDLQAASIHNIAEQPEKKRVLSERKMKLLHSLKAGMATADRTLDVNSKRSSAANSYDNAEPQGASAAESRLSTESEGTPKHIYRTKKRESDAVSYVSQHSRQSSTSKHVVSPQLTRSVPKSKKEQSYLPTGSALPELPVKRRSTRPRAAVQYVALAEIIENTERAQQRDAMGSAYEEDGIDFDNDAAVNMERRLRRNLSRKGNNDAAFQNGSLGDVRSTYSRNTASSSGGTLMELLRTGPVELRTASTEHSGSKAVIEMLSPEDYGDIDQLLADLDGIMSGSLAARRRFSLAVMRHSIAVDNGLVDPVDYSEPNDGEAGGMDNVKESFIEFKPLEIPNIDTDTDGLLSDGLGLDSMLVSTVGGEDDDDSQPLSELALRPSAIGDIETQLAALDVKSNVFNGNAEASSQSDLYGQKIEHTQPVELTRAQKVEKALGKLELLSVRKISIRIYVQDAKRYYTFSLTKYTTCEMIISDMKKSRIIDPDKDTWALFELVDHFGIERPLNHFENLMSLVESWEPRSNNYIIVKGYPQQSSLTLASGVQPGDHAVQGMLYYRIKKNKWQKGVFRLHDHSMDLIKDGRGKAKKEAHYLTLTNNDVYTPFEPLRGAPTRFVFGLKSEMPIQMFEKPDEDYVRWFAVHTLDSLREWLRILRLSKNQIKFCQVLERRVAETSAIKADGENKGATTRPLVDLSMDKHGDDTDTQGKRNTDLASELLSSISKIAASSKYDPATLVRAMEQGGIDVSDLKDLSATDDAHQENGNCEDSQTNENLFQPGSLLSKPKKLSAAADANKQDIELFAKGSLLSQPRESKALEASRAMQNIMAHHGNVFTQGSLLQVTDQSKPRPPHVGGAANIQRNQMPLVQVDEPISDFGTRPLAVPASGSHFDYLAEAGGAHPTTMHGMPFLQHGAATTDDQHIFGGLLAANSNQQSERQMMQSNHIYSSNNAHQPIHYR